MKPLEEFDVSNYTNWLRCHHCQGHSHKTYYMPCTKVKEMPDGERVKIVVFGERDWKDTFDKKRVRYVNKDRVLDKELLELDLED